MRIATRAFGRRSSAVRPLWISKPPRRLALAARDGRVRLTHDQTTMPRHVAAFIATATRPGVLMIPPRLPLATAVEDGLLRWSTMEAAEWRNTIRFLPL
jgi:hypothetical protein